jgi:hypothetical protein
VFLIEFQSASVNEPVSIYTCSEHVDRGEGALVLINKSIFARGSVRPGIFTFTSITIVMVVHFGQSFRRLEAMSLIVIVKKNEDTLCPGLKK